MANGLNIPIMVMYGSRMPDRTLYHIQHKVIGSSQTTDGHGCQITPGAGLLFIMDVGITINIMAGSGYLIMNGVPHGSHGEGLKVIMAGLLWSRELVFLSVLAGDMIAVMITGYSL